MPTIIEEMDEFITVIGSKQDNAYRGSTNGISPTITSAMGLGGGMIPLLTNATIEQTKTNIFMEEVRKPGVQLPPELQGKKFRIRKLTPRETGRLMGLNDDEIDKMFAAGLSNSALYRCHGNSIVCDVLEHIFRKMFIETEPDVVKGKPQQLTLF